MQWQVGDGQPRTPGATRLELKHGDLIRLERTSEKGPNAGKGPLVARDQPWSIVVTK